MQFTVAIVAAILSFTSSAVANPIDYTPPGGWGSVQYPKGTGENLPYYPPPPGGWESVKYPAGTGAGASGTKCPASPFIFTSTYHVIARGDQVVNNSNVATPGSKDAIGIYEFGINGPMDTICYNITLLNVAGTYQSPARTATHVHEAVRGRAGPPRLAFPNPAGDDKRRSSIGCLTGPFTTGLNGTNGLDTGLGFKVSQIEANPAGFFADAHTNLFVAGVVRGQFPA